ncbi:pyridoxamine 5'-phosphate oxidase family protein [Streptomyces sp. NPDC002851]
MNMTTEMSPDDALRHLAAVPFGRVVFTHRALPAVRPVHHVLDRDRVVIRTHGGAALRGQAEINGVVAYEADELDPETRTGWSVILTGVATVVEDPELLTRYRARLEPWPGEDDLDTFISISSDIVTGYHLGPGHLRP